MGDIAGLENKEFIITLEWVIDASDLVLEDGIENTLDTLRETGSAEVKSVRLRDKGAR